MTSVRGGESTYEFGLSVANVQSAQNEPVPGSPDEGL